MHRLERRDQPTVAVHHRLAYGSFQPEVAHMSLASWAVVAKAADDEPQTC